LGSRSRPATWRRVVLGPLGGDAVVEEGQAQLAEHLVHVHRAGHRGQQPAVLGQPVQDLGGEGALAHPAHAVHQPPRALGIPQGLEGDALLAPPTDEIPHPAHHHAGIEPRLGHLGQELEGRLGIVEGQHRAGGVEGGRGPLGRRALGRGSGAALALQSPAGLGQGGQG
jgi:hypothetical protein